MRVERRRRLRGTGSPASFERVALRIGGRRVRAVLKVMAPDELSPPRERRFYAELAREVGARVPDPFATGDLDGSADGWVLIEELPPRKPRAAWTRDDVLACGRELAKLHARHLGRAPDWLPRPLTRDAVAFLAHVPAGVARLRAFVAERPAWRWFAPESALSLAESLARAPASLAQALARSPETVIHRDSHAGNFALPHAGRPILFDWELVSAGAPIFDLTLFFQYLGWVWWRLPWLGIETSRCRPPPLAWEELFDTYLRQLENETSGRVDADAIAAAEPAARVWEAVYRMGWIERQLGQSAGWMGAARSALPMLSAFARWRVGHAGLESRASLWADLERFGPRFLP